MESEYPYRFDETFIISTINKEGFSSRNQPGVPLDEKIYDLRYFYGDLLEDNGMFLKPDPVDPTKPFMISWGLPRVTETTFYFPEEKVRKRRYSDLRSVSGIIGGNDKITVNMGNSKDTSGIESDLNEISNSEEVNQTQKDITKEPEVVSDENKNPEMDINKPKSSIPVPAKFCCTFPSCEKNYFHKPSLERHVVMCHNKVQKKSNKQKRRKSIKIKNNGNNQSEFKCPHCISVFPFKYRLQTHLEDFHNIKHYCPVNGCNKEYKRNLSLYRHMKKNHPKYRAAP